MIFWADAELLGLSDRNWAITSLGADSGNIVRWEPGSQDVPRDPIGFLGLHHSHRSPKTQGVLALIFCVDLESS